MGAKEPVPGWDQQVDVVVVGSGAGGLTAALCCQSLGMSALVVEKDKVYGGTSAVSGGGIWIPMNDQMAGQGVQDSYEEALSYVKSLTLGQVPDARLDAYLKNAPDMVRYMAQQFGVRFDAVPNYSDYFPTRPGAKAGSRSMEPALFDARQLGDEFLKLREPYKGTLIMGRMSMTQVECHTVLCRGRGWVGIMIKMLLKYWLDFGWRRRTWRDRRLALGQAMIAAMRFAMLKRKVPLLLDTALEDLVEDNGRVTGVVVRSGGRVQRIGARRGVVLASGGFESNQAMREQYLPKPTQAVWSAAPGANQGDGIRAGQRVGAALGFMDRVWGAPTVAVPGASPQAAALFIERQLPGCVMVNGHGKRFVNEASPYTEIVDAMYADHAKSGATVPCWLIFDAEFRKKYPMGPLLPGSMAPDSKLPAEWKDSVYYREDSLDVLAKRIGVDAKGLAETVANMNRYAQTGKDTEFGKGDNVFDRYYGDGNVKPNPCLAPIGKAPFYAMRIDAGDIGTKGGLMVDTQARVLKADGRPIAGLYATGNCSAAVMGPTYAGAGATIGPAMTFAYIAARTMADCAVSQQAAA